MRWILALCLAACGPGALSPVRYDLDQSLRFNVSAELANELDRQGLAADFDHALHHAAIALGTRRAPDGHLIPVSLTADCVEGRAAQATQRGIEICHGQLDGYSLQSIILTVMHEAGHVMGAQHVPCDGRSVMAELFLIPDCRQPAAIPDLEAYSPADLAEICRLAYGRACERAAS